MRTQDLTDRFDLRTLEDVEIDFAEAIRSENIKGGAINIQDIQARKNLGRGDQKLAAVKKIWEEFGEQVPHNTAQGTEIHLYHGILIQKYSIKDLRELQAQQLEEKELQEKESRNTKLKVADATGRMAAALKQIADLEATINDSRAKIVEIQKDLNGSISSVAEVLGGQGDIQKTLSNVQSTQASNEEKIIDAQGELQGIASSLSGISDGQNGVNAKIVEVQNKQAELSKTSRFLKRVALASALAAIASALFAGIALVKLFTDDTSDNSPNLETTITTEDGTSNRDGTGDSSYSFIAPNELPDTTPEIQNGSVGE